MEPLFYFSDGEEGAWGGERELNTDAGTHERK